jgi:hypothetical protein
VPLKDPKVKEVKIGFEGPRGDVTDLMFSLFEAGMLTEGLQKDAPGNARIVLKPMVMRKRPLDHAVLEIGLYAGNSIAVPLFVTWLYDKWQKQNQKPISIVIHNHFYQFDKDLLIKAIEDAIRAEELRPMKTSNIGAPCKTPGCQCVLGFGTVTVGAGEAGTVVEWIEKFEPRKATCQLCNQTARYTRDDLQEFPLADGKCALAYSASLPLSCFQGLYILGSPSARSGSSHVPLSSNEIPILVSSFQQKLKT